MPRCAVRHVKLVAEADLPVLPFLAPRVFQPWPFPSPPSSSRTRVRNLCTGAKHDTKPICQKLDDGVRQKRCFSMRSGERERRARPSTLPVKDKSKSSRSLLAQQWYKNAIAPVEEANQDQEEVSPGQDAQQEQGNLERRKRRSHARDPEEKKRKKWATARAILKSRWTAANDESSRVRSTWVSIGQPVRRRPKSTKDKEELAFSVDDYTLVWNRHFAPLNATYDAPFKHLPAHRTTPNLNSKAPRWAEKLLKAGEMESVEKVLGTEWRKKWLHAMLWTLAHAVHDAPRLLEITHVAPYLPAPWIADSLHYLSQHYTVNQPDDQSRENLTRVFCTVMERPSSRPLHLISGTLHRLLKSCTESQALRLYDTAVVNGVTLHWNTRLHLATYLAHHGHYDRALDALLDAVSVGADVKSPQFESNCATILRKAAHQPDGLRVSLHLVQNLADIGVKLNVQLCNIVMLNAVEAGDLKTAFAIYHSLVENNLRADKYTHAILLKGCKSIIQDSETLNATIRQAIADTEVLKSDIVATEIIHCLFLHHFKIDPRHAFSTLAEAFTQLFDTTSLIDLGVLPESHDNISLNRMQPTPAALGIMITAHIRRDLLLHKTASYSTHHMYRRWRDFVEQGTPPFAQLAETDYVTNAFLLAFTHHSSTLASAAAVIRDMQTPLPGTSSRTIEPCQPTVQSWSIFLHGFSKAKKMDLAEQVMKYMRKKGMRPNQVTWNSLVGGYAKSGDSESAVEAFRRMRDEGFRVNEVTERAIGRIRGSLG